MDLLTAIAAGFTVVLVVPYLAYLLLYAVVRPEGSPVDKRSLPEAELPSVSIVLPTYNEERIVEGKLEELCSLDYPMDRVEVVVVDSSEDETPHIVEEFFEDPKPSEDRSVPSLELLRETDRRGLAPALNDAYAAASNEVVVKTDCDSRMADDAIREAVANLADPAVGAVTGRNADVLGGSAVEAGYRGVQSRIQALESHLDSTLIFHGPFSAFENDAIVPIDPNSLADDTELALKIRRGGRRVLFDPAIRYKEAAHSEFRKRRTQKDRRGMGLIRLLVQHRDALGRYGRYGRIVLPFNWWFMIISPWLLWVVVAAWTGVAVTWVGLAGLGVPGAVIAFAWLGHRELLGPLQAPYAIFDTQVSLLFAAVALVRRDSDGTWEVDQELRDAYE